MQHMNIIGPLAAASANISVTVKHRQQPAVASTDDQGSLDLTITRREKSSSSPKQERPTEVSPGPIDTITTPESNVRRCRPMRVARLEKLEDSTQFSFSKTGPI